MYEQTSGNDLPGVLVLALWACWFQPVFLFLYRGADLKNRPALLAAKAVYWHEELQTCACNVENDHLVRKREAEVVAPRLFLARPANTIRELRI